MTGRELAAGVTRQATLIVLVAAIAAAWLGGARGALGVLTGGGLGVLGFRVLASRASALTAGQALSTPWLLLAAARFLVVSGVAALLFVGGWAHPVAWLAGYSVLPVALVLQGLRVAREES